MSSLKASTRRSSSSMSFHSSSARYSSSSSSYRRQGSSSPGPESPDPAPFLLEQDPPPGAGPQYLAHLMRPGRAVVMAHTDATGGAVPGRRSSSAGSVHLLGDTYYTSAELSRFEPPDIAIMAYNNQVVIHAEKVMEDGSVSDTFTQKASLPDDMDPLSVRGTLSSDGVLVVSVQRILCIGGGGGGLSEPLETQPSASNFTFDP